METKEVQSPKGRTVTLTYREDSSDLATIGATWRLWGKLEDEYRLASLPPLKGTALDIGAHIGSVALALLVDHPDLRVIAVEPLAENVAVMRLNAVNLDVADRLTILTAGISATDWATVQWNWRGGINDGYWQNNRYIGNVLTGEVGIEHDEANVPGILLTSLVPKRERIPVMKIDCEGCEWVALADKVTRRIDRIVGEYHGHPGPEGLRAMLASHDVEVREDGACGMFWAVKR